MIISKRRTFDGFDQEPVFQSSSNDPSANLSVSDLNHVENELNEQFKNVGFDEVVKLQSNGGLDLKAVESNEEEEEEEEEEEAKNENVYPVRDGVEDCSFYMRTGSCKYGLSCRFNHPIGRRIQIGEDNKVREKEEDEDKLKLMDCKYYFRTGGCKYGEGCKFNHTNPKTYAISVPELNFLGLPIRPGEVECTYYMRNGSCKFGSDCKFNHPVLMSIGGTDSPSFHGNGGSIGSFSPKTTFFQANSTSWSSPRHVNPNMLSQSRGVSSDFNGYQASVCSSERSVFPASTYLVNNSSMETSIFSKYRPQMLTEEFPERPDQPECSYYIKTGDCKFKYSCKYHHPKNRLPKQPPFALNDKGLPLRPDQSICTHYSRYGICKFGPACRFDHSNQPTYSMTSSQAVEPPQVSTNGNESDGWN